MAVTREELQQAGASPELAQILADRWPQRDSGDLTRHPMAVALLIAFLGALGWLVVSVTDLQSGQARLEEKLGGLDQKLGGLDQRITRIEDKLDQLLQR